MMRAEAGAESGWSPPGYPPATESTWPQSGAWEWKTPPPLPVSCSLETLEGQLHDEHKQGHSYQDDER